jgi:hypothetical protein
MANRFAEKFQAGLMMGQGLMDTFEKAKLKRDLAEAGKLTPEQQTLGVNAPAQGQVPQGYEQYIQAGEGGGFAPKMEEGLTPEQVSQRQTIASSFSQPGAFQGAKTSYSLGGLSQEKAFTPEDVTAARRRAMADVYTKYGDVDRADMVMERADQAKMRGMQMKELEATAAIRDRQRANAEEYANVKRNLEIGSKSITDAVNAGKMPAEEGAKLLQDFYNHNVPNGFNLEIADGKMWHQDPKNPNKKVGTDITPQSISEAFKDMPKLIDKAYEAKHNALASDFKSIAEERRHEETMSKEDRRFNEGIRQFDAGQAQNITLANLKINSDKDLQDARIIAEKSMATERYKNDEKITRLKASIDAEANKNSPQYKVATIALAEATKKNELIDKYNEARGKNDFNGMSIYGKQLEVLDPKGYTATKMNADGDFVSIGVLSSQANSKNMINSAMGDVKDDTSPNAAGDATSGLKEPLAVRNINTLEDLKAASRYLKPEEIVAAKQRIARLNANATKTLAARQEQSRVYNANNPNVANVAEVYSQNPMEQLFGLQR